MDNGEDNVENLTIIALTRLFPPSTREPAVIAETGDDADARHSASKDNEESNMLKDAAPRRQN